MLGMLCLLIWEVVELIQATIEEVCILYKVLFGVNEIMKVKALLRQAW